MDHNEQIIAESIDYLVAHYHERPSLEALAARAGYETTYFQRLFQQKVGVSPKRFIQYLSYRQAREFLLEGYSALSSADAAGLSGGGRLHDLFVSVEAATPGEVKAKGRGLLIRYGWHASHIGEIIIAVTPRGLCWLGFRVDESRAFAESRMRAWWPLADFAEDTEGTRAVAGLVMDVWQQGGFPPSRPPPSSEGEEYAGKLRLHLYGTNFQIQVWRALLQIPSGRYASYQQVAQAIGSPKSCRAVGGAVGANPVSLIIPCHRVIRSTGVVENYGWGSARKKALLGLETAS